MENFPINLRNSNAVHSSIPGTDDGVKLQDTAEDTNISNKFEVLENILEEGEIVELITSPGNLFNQNIIDKALSGDILETENFDSRSIYSEEDATKYQSLIQNYMASDGSVERTSILSHPPDVGRVPLSFHTLLVSVEYHHPFTPSWYWQRTSILSHSPGDGRVLTSFENLLPSVFKKVGKNYEEQKLGNVKDDSPSLKAHPSKEKGEEKPKFKKDKKRIQKAFLADFISDSFENKVE
ncbi:hypothetical protein MA16_Dca023116 [Dendrobium catenatum]|uniref:Uncharacterized protein n=1 Tax=Dendrobium catenatum TaxID=906689 RepID=A0A2I0VCM6_9ASPA|nr:hypothetical protein MA16_Dca023116 [Dendrobium catenatum]